MMDTFAPQQIAVRLAVAALVGMLIGFERESSHKGVGIRTFSLVSLLGMVTALLGQAFVLEAVGLVAVLTLATSLRQGQRGQLGLTTSVALVSTTVLGAVIGFGHTFTPIAAAIIITMLLSLSDQFQRITDGVSSAELRSAVLLGLIGFVIYPALPDHAIDRYSLLNPQEAWITVIVVASIGFLNYVLLRIYARRGLYYAAVLGGLVNSTAAIAEVARWVRMELSDPVSLGITLSMLTAVAMFVRNFAIVAIFSHGTAKLVALPLLLMGAACVLSVYLERRRGTERVPGKLELDSPVSLPKVLRFAAIFLVIQISGTLAQRFFGSFGFILVALLGGIFSSASTAAAAAHLAAHNELTPQLAGVGVVISSIASALVNIPVLQRETRNRILTVRLTAVTLAVAAVGIVVSVLEFKFKVHF